MTTLAAAKNRNAEAWRAGDAAGWIGLTASPTCALMAWIAATVSPWLKLAFARP
jgi:hypothetical protein